MWVLVRASVLLVERWESRVLERVCGGARIMMMMMIKAFCWARRMELCSLVMAAAIGTLCSRVAFTGNKQLGFGFESARLSPYMNTQVDMNHNRILLAFEKEKRKSKRISLTGAGGSFLSTALRIPKKIARSSSTSLITIPRSLASQHIPKFPITLTIQVLQEVVKIMLKVYKSTDRKCSCGKRENCQSCD
ncbi:phosphate-specific transport system accessory protein PhoU homolog [Striga asiatica]|uniref:Phosphate-specific transport system accessory protein PhoU homolog n=1 Tax=Striga asiatica TaxID=4170 RepID=A0A5A7P1I9_STRAF|nr:phosphate-specific transport system accessory protein PhoU homolog [Striga asiatica]